MTAKNLVQFAEILFPFLVNLLSLQSFYQQVPGATGQQYKPSIEQGVQPEKWRKTIGHVKSGSDIVIAQKEKSD